MLTLKSTKIVEDVNFYQDSKRYTWSPEQIANTVLKRKISFKTIYNWLYQNRLHRIELSVLRKKGKPKNPAEKRGKFAISTRGGALGLTIHH